MEIANPLSPPLAKGGWGDLKAIFRGIHFSFLEPIGKKSEGPEMRHFKIDPRRLLERQQPGSCLAGECTDTQPQ